MARPFKTGVDYFPLDVVMDDKIKLIQAQHKIVGFAIVIKLYQKVYAHNYWVNWDKKAVLVFSDENNIDINEVDVVINSCIEWGVFDKKLYETYSILTSKGIQKRYFEIIKRRKKVGITNEFLLVDYKEYLDVEKINVIIYGVNADINSQSKVKETKLKEIKYPKDSDEFRLSSFLFNHILKNNPKHKKPNFQKWSADADLLLRKDNKPLEEIKKIIIWTQNDSFEKSNILSISKLRKRYDQLFIKMNSSDTNDNPDDGLSIKLPDILKEG